MKKSISLFLVLLGIALIIVGLFSGANTSYSFSGLRSFYHDNVSGQLHDSSNQSGRQKVDFEAMDYVQCSFPMGKLEILPSPDNKVHLDYQTKGVGWSQKLYVDQQETALILNFQASHKLAYIADTTTYLYLPKDVHRLKVSIEMDKLEMKDLHQLELDLQASMGSVDIENCHLSGTLSLEMGSLELEDTLLENITLDLEMGSLKGECSFLGKNQANVQMGSIKLTLLQDPKEVKFNLNAKMGSVVAPSGSETSNSKAELSAQVQMGSIVITAEDKDD